MERIKLGTDQEGEEQELECSRLVYGVWRLDDAEGLSSEEVERLAEERITACLELGITTFDHADIYGDYRCESLFGAALARNPSLRDGIELVTKCDICLLSEARPEHRVKHYDTTPGHIERSVETSLRNLSTDRIDLLLLHRPDPLMDAEQTAKVLDGLVSSGKVLHLGVSNFTPSQFELLQSRLDRPLLTNQIEISVLRTEALLDGTLDQAQRLGRPPMAWSPLAGGELFGNGQQAERVRAALARVATRHGLEPGAIDQVAIAWLLQLPSRPLPILGTQNLERLQGVARACDIELARQDWFEIFEASLGQEVP